MSNNATEGLLWAGHHQEVEAGAVLVPAIRLAAPAGQVDHLAALEEDAPAVHLEDLAVLADSAVAVRVAVAVHRAAVDSADSVAVGHQVAVDLAARALALRVLHGVRMCLL